MTDEPRSVRPVPNGEARYGTDTRPRLAPMPDTGITLGERSRPRPRPRRRRSRTRVRDTAVVLALVLLSLLGALAWRGIARHLTATPTGASAVASAATPVMEIEPASDPTPLFASYRSLQLRLPVSSDSVTQLAFHQASGEDALPMSALVPDADMRLAARTRVMRRHPSTATDAAEAAEQGVAEIFNGEALRMWRSNRRGKPDSAADVGAPPGTAVFAPVSGTVAAVRAYSLYGRYPDFEIHIQPTGWPEVDVVLIHVTSVQVKTGEAVGGGITPLARVRRLSDKVIPQLGQYTKDGGDHVHVQLNRLAVPGRIELVGGS